MTYPELIERIQQGRPPAMPTIEAVLAAAGRTASDLVRDCYDRPPARRGQPCVVCGRGRLKVLNTMLAGSTRVQYIGCGKCGYRPPKNKLVCYEP